MEGDCGWKLNHMAGQACRANGLHSRYLSAANVLGKRTTRMKGAALRWRHGVGPFKNGQGATANLPCRGDQATRVGVQWAPEQGLGWLLLHDMAQVHHGHPGREVPDDMQIMADQYIR